MGWSVYGEVLETSDLSSGLRVYQPVKFNKNVVLKAIRAWFIVYNDPTFSDIYFEIWSNKYEAAVKTPSKLLHTSTNLITKSQLISESNGVREAYWEFDNPSFYSGDWYNFVPRAHGYTGSDSSHLAWKKAWPDPPYRTGLDVDYEELHVSPFNITFIGATR